MLKTSGLTVLYDKDTVGIQNIDLTVEDGEFVAVIGSSGSGKSTLMKSFNLLVQPSSGSVIIDGNDLMKMNKKELSKMRREIGFVFQDYNLIDRLTVLENVLLGRLGYKSTLSSMLEHYSDEEIDIARRAIQTVGLSEKILERASELSGGQKQRVAIAKALCQQPSIILADEPVSSLDIKTAQDILNYLKKVNEEENITVILNIHDVTLAKKYGKRILALREGEIVFDGTGGDLNEELLATIYEFSE